MISAIKKTSEQYDAIIANCRDIFARKMKDYGTSWRMFRISSITDQVFIKAQRVRTIEETGTQKVNDDIRGEYIGMVNYSVIALIQMELENDNRTELPYEEALALYDKHATAARSLMQNKNHDYGEAWRDMRLSSLTDLILVKLLRIKQIEDNSGNTEISEGIDANYLDIINYAIFALIRISEGK
ncbi:MAG TPA: DUF1599 domain-containing protein [Bacteroidia bacterium]|nr:DUF1599 domain-containing protein [Bacteroidia bacterium]